MRNYITYKPSIKPTTLLYSMKCAGGHAYTWIVHEIFTRSYSVCSFFCGHLISSWWSMWSSIYPYFFRVASHMIAQLPVRSMGTKLRNNRNRLRISWDTLPFLTEYPFCHVLRAMSRNKMTWFWTLKWSDQPHYDDVIVSAIASQIASLTIVYSTVYSGAIQRNSPLTRELPTQRASNTEYVSIWWCFQLFQNPIWRLREFCIPHIANDVQKLSNAEKDVT